MIVAAVQMTSTSDKGTNREKAARFIAMAAGAKAEIVLLPEHWDWLGKPEEKAGAAEPIHGPSVTFLRELAKRYRLSLIAGSITEANGNDPPFNTTVLIHPDGMVGRTYRKIHLFDSELDRAHRESAFTSAGDEVVVEGLGLVTVGFSICYDVRFPELFQQLARRGADLFVIPANFTAHTGPPHWEVLVRARAIENQCFILAADQTGLTGAGWEAHGHSMIVSPWGEILAMAGKEETVITARLDLNTLKEIRKKIPVHEHRKLI